MKWEYKFVKIAVHENVELTLNPLGLAGWEVVGFAIEDEFRAVLLKRRITTP
jgi:hypothetical protein